MTKTEIKKLAKQKIAEGKSHQETFDEIRKDSETRQSLESKAKVIRFIPTLEKRKKFKGVHWGLVILLAGTVALKLILGFAVISRVGAQLLPVVLLFPVINIILLIGLIQFKSQYYRIIAVLAIFGLLQSLFRIANNFNIAYLIDLAINGVLIILALFLHSKMVSKYYSFREKYTNAEGEISKRETIKFDKKS